MAEIGDVVELIVDVEEVNLRTGMQGTIVHCHSKEVYEVEFSDKEGETLELLALGSQQFIVVWQASNQEWVSISQQASELIAKLPKNAAIEVLDFARFISAKVQRMGHSEIISVNENIQH
ncbi:DUF4926 domain-containing protein [Deltaproteobacteria bacterium TL4]